MTKSLSMLKDTLLPLLLFPTISAIAINYTHLRLRQDGAVADIQGRCFSTSPDENPYRLVYTGFHDFDRHLCGYVTLFHVAMTQGVIFNFTSYFVYLILPAYAILCVEGSRNGRSTWIAAPVIYGLVSQVFAMAVIMPLYWLAFILTGSAKRTRQNELGGGVVSQGNAEAVVFGFIVGCIIPSVGMLYLDDPYVTAIWQPFPMIVSIAQFAHTLFRRPSQLGSSGYGTIQMLYIALFVISSSVHIATIWPISTDVQALKDLLLPSIAPLSQASTMEYVHDFLKWDFIFGFTPFVLGSLWFASSLKQLLFLVLWYSIAVPAFGPGAALMGPALWRESVISREKSKVALKNESKRK